MPPLTESPASSRHGHRACETAVNTERRKGTACDTDRSHLPPSPVVGPTLASAPTLHPAAQDGSWRRQSQLVCTRATSPWCLCVFARVFSAYSPARMSFLVARAWTASSPGSCCLGELAKYGRISECIYLCLMATFFPGRASLGALLRVRAPPVHRAGRSEAGRVTPGHVPRQRSSCGSACS